jgi:hypothetical protein
VSCGRGQPSDSSPRSVLQRHQRYRVIESLDEQKEKDGCREDLSGLPHSCPILRAELCGDLRSAAAEKPRI